MKYIKKLIPAKTYVDGALKLLTTRKLEYINRAPYNCGYCHPDLRISGDCWCINPKTMVWSIAMNKPVWENRTVGFYYYADGIAASGLPDWDGASILNGYCENITFKKMRSENIAPALLLNANETHMGAYIGEFKLADGNTYNTMEFTPANGISPRMASYVDDDGARRVCKGGRVVSYWARAGKMTGIIDYANKENVTPPQPSKPYSIDNLAVHIMRGDFGSGEARKAAIRKLGYTDAEIQKAQNIVNDIYAAHEMDKLAADLAMKFISGEAGDGVTMRRQWIADHYKDYDAEKLFRATQDKVNAYIPS